MDTSHNCESSARLRRLSLRPTWRRGTFSASCIQSSRTESRPTLLPVLFMHILLPTTAPPRRCATPPSAASPILNGCSTPAGLRQQLREPRWTFASRSTMAPSRGWRQHEQCFAMQRGALRSSWPGAHRQTPRLTTLARRRRLLLRTPARRWLVAPPGSKSCGWPQIPRTPGAGPSRWRRQLRQTPRRHWLPLRPGWWSMWQDSS
mmetsp:Transcript_9474/g.26627  ORF Transcript_9474/g.26627 Transcript_9474/m.26627 type:complete len:205 (-) Transcript_9474:498-1112(-)